MVEAMVTVGISNDNCGDTIWMEFKSLPQIGDIILPNVELKKMINAKKKQWNTYPDAHINYVKTIAHTDGGHPIIMLSFNPSLIIVDLHYYVTNDDIEFERWSCMAIQCLPKVSDLFSLPDVDKKYIVTRIEHSQDSITLHLQKTK